MTDRYFEVDRINVRYGDIRVLWDIEFMADKGGIVALVGSNGAGKSTTVKSCAGLIRSFQGNVRLDGHNLTGAVCRTFINRGVIPVPEGRQLFPSMTVYENLEMGASSKAAKVAKKGTTERICNWFPRLKDRRDQLTGALSGSGQQMLAFSRDMMGFPKFLIMDELSLGLTPNTADNIFSATKGVAQESGLTIILVEQDVRKALRIANRGYVIENSQITVSDTVEELLNNDKVRKAYLGFQDTVGSCVLAAAETDQKRKTACIWVN